MTTENKVTVTPVSKAPEVSAVAPAAAVAPTEAPKVDAPVDTEVAVTEGQSADATTTEEEKKKPRGMSKYLATVKEREQKAAAKEAEIAERERKLKEAEQNASKVSEVTAEDLKLRPSEFLKKHGMTFEEFAKAVINEGNGPTAEDELENVKKKLSKLEQDQLDKQKKEEEERAASEQAYIDKAVSDYKVLLRKEIETRPDDYELIIANNAFDLVFEVVQSHYLQTLKESPDGKGRILDFKVAAEETEKYLLEQARKLLNLKKLGVEKKEEGKKSEASGMRTLTNSVGSHSQPSTGIPSGLSREERLKMASQKLVYN